jgi:hypothetical protein
MQSLQLYLTDASRSWLSKLPDNSIGSCVIMVKQHMPWDGLSRGRTKHWRIRERGTR